MTILLISSDHQQQRMRSRTLSLSADAVRCVLLAVKNKCWSGHTATMHEPCVDEAAGMSYGGIGCSGKPLLEHIRGTEFFFMVTTKTTTFCDDRVEDSKARDHSILHLTIPNRRPSAAVSEQSCFKLPSALSLSKSRHHPECDELRKENNGGPKRGAFASCWKTKRPFKGSFCSINIET